MKVRDHLSFRALQISKSSSAVVSKLATAYDVNYGVRSVANEVQRVAIQLVADAEMKGQILEK